MIELISFYLFTAFIGGIAMIVFATSNNSESGIFMIAIVLAVFFMTFMFVGMPGLHDNICEQEGYDKTTDWKEEECDGKVIIMAECDGEKIIPFERTSVCSEVDKWDECSQTEYEYKRVWEGCKK